MSRFKGKQVLVVGFGVSGVAVAKYMVKQGANVVVTDAKQRSELSESFKMAGDLPIEFDLGKHTPKYFTESELVVVSPGVPSSTQPLSETRERGIPITTEIELAATQIKEPIVAVTGTNGKTTVTTLIGEMFKVDQKKTFVGGNIGIPLFNYLLTDDRSEYVIAEFSSFQLEWADKLVPAVAVFTNIEPDHMDRYPSMEAYIQAKKKLLKVCDKQSYVILNYDDPILRTFAPETNAKILWYTKKNPMDVGGEFAEQFRGAYFPPGTNVIKGQFTGKEEVYDLSRFRLLGDHNRENLMAAICAARVMGVSPKAIQKVIETFPGVPHRIEFVRKKDGVYFFNDSKSTNPDSLRKCLEAFKRSSLILIAGGKDKDSDFASLAHLVKQKVKMLILLGEAKEKMNRALGDNVETYLVGTFEEAVLLAYQKSRSGDIILLSPGCASYDMFRNYEERGEYFKKLVQQL